MTMPRGMHVHLLDFNEHMHSEDSMPHGVHMHFQKAHMSFPKKNPRKERKQKKWLKLGQMKNFFEILLAEHVVEDVFRT